MSKKKTVAGFQADSEISAETALVYAQIARSELETITAGDSIGKLLDVRLEPLEVQAAGVRCFTLIFKCKINAYAGWVWAVTLSQVGAAEPTVMELGLVAGEESILAPEWVPWSVRLAQFRQARAQEIAAQEAAAAEAAAEFSDEYELEDDLLDNDFSDFDDEINGVDFEDADLDDFADTGSASETHKSSDTVGDDT